MPDAPTWVAAIPETLEELKVSGQRWFGRRDIEEILGVQRRQAINIMGAAGAKQEGKALILDKENLVTYLKTVGREVLAEEQRRREKLARSLTDMRSSFMEQPHLLVEVDPEVVRDLKRKKYKALPPGVDLGPGFVSLKFQSVKEALEQLVALCVVIGSDSDEFEARTKL